MLLGTLIVCKIIIGVRIPLARQCSLFFNFKDYGQITEMTPPYMGMRNYKIATIRIIVSFVIPLVL